MHPTPFGLLADPRTLESPTDDAFWIIPDWFAAGPHPLVDGPDRLDDLLDAGFDMFVNLTAQHIRGSSDAFLHDYEPTVRDRGGRTIHLPISDMATPTHDQTSHALDQIDEALGQAGRVYLHCLAGLGRTGTILGCWLIRHGVGPDTAVDELRGLRWGITGDSPQTNEQIDFVLRWDRTARGLE